MTEELVAKRHGKGQPPRLAVRCSDGKTEEAWRCQYPVGQSRRTSGKEAAGQGPQVQQEIAVAASPNVVIGLRRTSASRAFGVMPYRGADVDGPETARRLKMLLLAPRHRVRIDFFRRNARATRPIAALLATFLVGACSSARPMTKPVSPASSGTVSTGAPTTTTTVSPLASRYLQILGPADAAAGQFFAALKALPTTATGAAVQKIATPAADAIDIADRQLLKVAWPGNVGRDIHALVTADEHLVGDLRDVGSQTTPASGPWRTHFENDVNAISKCVNAVHADLQTPNPPK